MIYILEMVVILEITALFIAVRELNKADHRIKLLEIYKKHLEERLVLREWYSSALKISIMLRDGNYSAQAIQRQEFQDLLMKTIQLYEKIRMLNPEMTGSSDMNLAESFYASLLVVKNSLPS